MPGLIPTVSEFEIEFCAVGDGSRSGDAIVCSWVETSTGVRRIVVVDGGYEKNGQEIVQLVHDRFGTSRIDLAVNTHPDDDHTNGLVVILSECQVDELLVHMPWEHGLSGSSLYSGRFADRRLPAAVMKSLDGVRILAEESLEEGVTVSEPFAGCTRLGGVVEILGPTVPFYESLLPAFRGSSLSATAGAGVGTTVLSKTAGVLTRLRESLDIETLTDSGETSAENNSSAVVQFNFNGSRYLLTGDAGIPALTEVADRLEECGETPSTLRLVQVPHHGSKRNVGPSVLDRLLGPRLGIDLQERMAVVSAAPEGEPKHPARQVTNAFRRRGAPVWATQGRSLRYDFNAPLAAYSPAQPLPFFDEVDE